MKPANILLMALMAFTCSTPPTGTLPETETETDFETIIGNGLTLRWYSDMYFDDWIVPMMWRADTCAHAADEGKYCVVASPVLDYRCTVLPDTMYGLIVRPYDKLFCVRDTCRSLRQDGVEYEIKTYRNNMLELCD